MGRTISLLAFLLAGCGFVDDGECDPGEQGCDCDDNGECQDELICMSDECVHPDDIECASSADCNAGEICSEARCLRLCNSDFDCGGGQSCVQSTCR